jgi:hypothetical protein
MFLAPVATFAAVPSVAPLQTRTNVPILQPLTGGGSPFVYTSIPANGHALFLYITESLAWMQEVAVGMVMLWLVFSGIMIMVSGNDQGKRTQAKEHAVAAIIGLVMLFLFGFLLSVINANFFTQ